MWSTIKRSSHGDSIAWENGRATIYIEKARTDRGIRYVARVGYRSYGALSLDKAKQWAELELLR